MEALLLKWIPNVIDYWPDFMGSIVETLQMMLYSGVLSILVGLILGAILVVTREGNILENRFVHHIIDIFVNIFRSIPFLILIFALYPVTKWLVGTGIGVRGVIFPLFIGCTPFFTRQVDMALSEVDPGVIEAAKAMGVSPFGIIFRVYLRESIPALVRAVSFTLISLLGLTAMGGAVGAGGVGAFVIRHGTNRFKYDIIYVSVVIILIFVSIIQLIGNYVVKKTSH